MSIKIGDKFALQPPRKKAWYSPDLIIRRTVWRSSSVTHLRT